MADHEMQTVVKYHTAGRRQPMLIGKDAAGRRLPGGPYTVYQVIALAAVATSMWKTRTLWASEMTGLSSLLVIGAAAVGAGFVTGRLDFSGRNPLWILLSMLGATPALLSARPGQLAGRSLPVGKPRKVRALAIAGRVPAETSDQPSVADPTPPPAEKLTPAPEPRPPTQVSVQPNVPAERLTPLEAFLAAAGKVS